jgi:hypothetical protein
MRAFSNGSATNLVQDPRRPKVPAKKARTYLSVIHERKLLLSTSEVRCRRIQWQDPKMGARIACLTLPLKEPVNISVLRGCGRTSVWTIPVSAHDRPEAYVRNLKQVLEGHAKRLAPQESHIIELGRSVLKAPITESHSFMNKALQAQPDRILHIGRAIPCGLSKQLSIKSATCIECRVPVT